MQREVIHMAIAAAKKGFTRDGLVTIEYEDVRNAASDIGLTLPSTPNELTREAVKLGGVRVANGHRNARFGFRPGVLERSTNGSPGVNHLGPIEARLIASKTYPRGIAIQIADCSEDYEMSATDLRTVAVTVADPDGVRVSQGAVVSLNLVPDSAAAVALKEILPARHSISRLSSVTRTVGADRIALGVRFQDGSEADLSGGSLICRHLSEANHQFTFFFSDVNKDSE
ncbi:hypothetical protein [Burkholderia ubonensis]|uniref:hypothetical protein n=1 Tax=Burkholderia ubonensis TaxID=101571 RepID=UPI0008FE75E1|nr:hypothetical protein [Burkholderia ubonensis]